MPKKKFILQAGTTADGVSVIDVVPIDQTNTIDEAPITVSTIIQNKDADALDETVSTRTAIHQQQHQQQQLTTQVAVVQSPDDSDAGPHYITVNVSQQDNVSPHNTYHVQYVDSELYSTPQGQTQMAYPVYAVGDYTSGTQQYYATTTGNYATGNGTGTGVSSTNTHGGGGGGGVANSQYIVPIDEALLTPQGRESSPQTIGGTDVNYVQHNTTPTPPINSEPECSPNLSHATRVSPATVAWLLDNYETAEGVSLPRSTLYNHYMRHCNEHKLDAVNAASFGKLIRSVFTGLRTRRLGTRGNSKYHYYGIRVKLGSNLTTASSMNDSNGSGQPSSSSQQQQQQQQQQHQHHGNKSNATNVIQHNNHNSTTRSRKLANKPETYEACAQYLGDGSAVIPQFPIIDFTQSITDDISLEDVDTFRSIYREHCEAFLDAILNLEFSTIESLWREFWRSQDNNNGDECEEEKYLSKYKLYALSHYEEIQEFVRQVDYTFYQNMVDVLIPDVLRPIPSSLTQAIRNFAKNLETWLSAAMAGCPEQIVQIKIGAVSAFSQTLRRYTSLNHLAQAARAVLQNGSQIAQMLNDLNRVDFHNVQEQASWVCQCDTATVQRFENEFKAALQQQNSLEQWATWLRSVVDSALDEWKGKPQFAHAARQFLLKWSFYSSMVIRDLTLRSAASFGSFHLIRLLYDEYMFFIIEHKVAEATNTTPIAVMSNGAHLEHMMQEITEPTEIEMIFSPEYEVKMESSPKRMRS